MFENHKVFRTEVLGRELVVETGKFAQLSNGSGMIRYGNTTVHVAVTASSKPREGIDFFPLSVDFEERLYAVGKIPGSFLKREGKPSEKAVLTSRVIDNGCKRRIYTNKIGRNQEEGRYGCDESFSVQR